MAWLLNAASSVFLRVWQFVTVTLVALLLGLAFAHVLERPAKLQYEGALYVTLQKSLYVEWGPPNIGGFLELAAILATVALIFGVRRRKASRTLVIVAALALLLAFPVVFFWLVQPANAVFRATPAGALPPDWEAWRAQWERGHAIRFALQFVAFGCLLWSILTDRPATSRQT